MVQLATGELAGDALLWSIDLHNRSAHVGISLRPAFRGRGLGTDAVRVLCRYGFAILGLQRSQAETLADNAAMIAAATRAGFVPEGRLRRSAWVNGQFADEVILGLLAADRARTHGWHPRFCSPGRPHQAAAGSSSRPLLSRTSGRRPLIL